MKDTATPRPVHNSSRTQTQSHYEEQSRRSDRFVTFCGWGLLVSTILLVILTGLEIAAHDFSSFAEHQQHVIARDAQ